eukprot:4017853-Alexandrium_andersonii.AAC.1
MLRSADADGALCMTLTGEIVREREGKKEREKVCVSMQDTEWSALRKLGVCKTLTGVRCAQRWLGACSHVARDRC